MDQFKADARRNFGTQTNVHERLSAIFFRWRFGSALAGILADVEKFDETLRHGEFGAVLSNSKQWRRGDEPRTPPRRVELTQLVMQATAVLWRSRSSPAIIQRLVYRRFEVSQEILLLTSSTLVMATRYVGFGRAMIAAIISTLNDRRDQQDRFGSEAIKRYQRRSERSAKAAKGPRINARESLWRIASASEDRTPIASAAARTAEKTRPKRLVGPSTQLRRQLAVTSSDRMRLNARRAHSPETMPRRQRIGILSQIDKQRRSIKPPRKRLNRKSPRRCGWAQTQRGRSQQTSGRRY